jgi:peptidoglycan/LPS O-acetylase OafA/YrhL
MVLSAAAIVTLLMIMNRAGGVRVWHPWRFVYTEIEALCWAAFIFGYLACRPFAGTWASRLIEGVGTISFSIYLLHYSMLREFWLTVYPQHFAGSISNLYGVFAATVLIAIPILGISLLSYLCIEKPFQDMRGKYLKARTSEMPIRGR